MNASTSHSTTRHHGDHPRGDHGTAQHDPDPRPPCFRVRADQFLCGAPGVDVTGQPRGPRIGAQVGVGGPAHSLTSHRQFPRSTNHTSRTRSAGALRARYAATDRARTTGPTATTARTRDRAQPATRPTSARAQPAVRRPAGRTVDVVSGASVTNSASNTFGSKRRPAVHGPVTAAVHGTVHGIDRHRSRAHLPAPGRVSAPARPARARPSSARSAAASREDSPREQPVTCRTHAGVITTPGDHARRASVPVPGERATRPPRLRRLSDRPDCARSVACRWPRLACRVPAARPGCRAASRPWRSRRR